MDLYSLNIWVKVQKDLKTNTNKDSFIERERERGEGKYTTFWLLWKKKQHSVG